MSKLKSLDETMIADAINGDRLAALAMADKMDEEGNVKRATYFRHLARRLELDRACRDGSGVVDPGKLFKQLGREMPVTKDNFSRKIEWEALGISGHTLECYFMDRQLTANYEHRIGPHRARYWLWTERRGWKRYTSKKQVELPDEEKQALNVLLFNLISKRVRKEFPK